MIAVWLKTFAKTAHYDKKDKMMFLIPSHPAYI